MAAAHGRTHAASWPRRLFGSKRRGSADAGTERTIYINARPPTAAHHPQYPANQIRTAKYTVLSFVPKNLFEQFRRAANIYFLFLLVLQFIPAVTTGMPGLSALALFTIVLLTMLKDGYEDSKRSASDREANRARAVVLGRGWVNVNKPPAHMLRPRGLLRLVFSDSGAGGSVGGPLPASQQQQPPPPPYDGDVAEDAMDVDGDAWLATEWRHVHVGDIVLLRDGDAVPADLVLLAASGADDSCFVETKNLDGETNLKTKAVVPLTAHLRSPARLGSFACAISAEPPSTQLYAFKGTIRQVGGSADGGSGGGAPEPLGVDNLLLRGSVVRNTAWAVGAVAFTGDDTKIMMNAGETPSKRSRIERMMNRQVLTQFCLLFVLCMLSAVLGGVYYGRGASFQALFVVAFQTHANRSAPLYGFLTFWTSLILYQTVVPISLYVTIEVVKSFQAYFINQDADMYYAPTDRRCVPKSWNLSDDLGQVEYIFSDKTGTLTQNVMVFRQCSIRGKVYGQLVPDDDDDEAHDDRVASLRRAMDARIAQFFDHPHRQGAAASFLDTAVYDDLQADGTQARAAIEFFTVLALCHTAVSHVPDAAQPHVIEYKAQSPDEAALVATARDVGFVFLRRDRDRLACRFLGHEQTYELLATLEFTSARKRMSVVVRRADGRIVLLCKGADSVVMARCRPGQERLRQATLDDLERFAQRGLRTLCLGYRILDEAEYVTWRASYDAALASLGDRDAEVEAACDALEQRLQLVGGTAIEDKLQDGVPDTIAQLALAGIKLWVLTGDKTETAINIGHSCNLLTADMQTVVVAAADAEGTRAQLERALLDFADTHADLSYAGGGGGAMAGVAPRKPGAWRRLLRRRAAASAADGLRDPAYEQARRAAADTSRRRGVRGVWDDVRTRNVPGGSRLRLRRDVPLALVVDGAALKHALEADLAPLFLEVAVRCRSVLCCRVSPLQKALVVRLVKRHLGALCLAVGDGANDVSMIQEADVGVGISGEEGLQAVMASDYAVGQFRFLQKLLLVHGRWSYLRIASMVLNFFYKNVVFTLSLFWFQIYCQWSVANFFDYALVTLYNMLFTSLPPGALGVFDQDLPAFAGVVVPQLYKRGIYKLEYSMARFWTYVADGLYQAAAVVFLVVYVYHTGAPAQRSGLDTADKDDVGTVGAFCVVLVTNLYMGLNNRNWTWVMPVAQLFGVALLLGVFFVYGAMFDDVFSAGAGRRVFVQPAFWLLLALTTVVCLLPHYVVKFVRSAWYPTDTDVVHEIIAGFRRAASKAAKHPPVAAAGPLNYGAAAAAGARKEVPFGAVSSQHRMARRHRHPGAVHSHAMDGAIPLHDLGPYLHSAQESFRSTTVLAQDTLTRPGLYQGTRYPESDAALVHYLHGLAHMGDPLF
ncbi:phospholipid transporting ATPase [Coemansia interrupta]|uniref:Phospholipid-transporting ATPase n=1 Tax=Coemansia interrupta TaxID=1126814 RepID=A0A9W8LLC6_9FUNG|nr:phospholipid transporting ATPase [Coemansia interrupta]